MVKVRIVPSECYPGKYAIEYKRFFSWKKGFWKKGFVSFVNGEWGNNVFPKDVAIEKANELFDLMNYKIKRK